MSLFCICAVEDIGEKKDKLIFMQQIENLAEHYKRGIKFFVDWYEPITRHIKKDSLMVNILDCPSSDNCEMFLLPDGWYSNGQTNALHFRERMDFLQSISNVFINRQYLVDIYLGQSGTNPEDFFSVTLKCNDLADYLTNSFSMEGIDNGIHIRVVP